MVIASSADGSTTNQPRLALTCTIPRVSSRIIASRTRVRDTEKRPASWFSLSRVPGRIRADKMPDTMASSMFI